MRCPKCHYITFGSVDRCRNCGYEFSLAPDAKPIDLPIQTPEQPLGPLGDLHLGNAASSSGEGHTASAMPGKDGAGGGAAAERGGTGQRGAAPRLDLPLFVDRDPLGDAPLVSLPAVPRQPLSVRRGQPAVPKSSHDKSAAGAVLEQKRLAEDEATSEEEEARVREKQLRSVRTAPQAPIDPARESDRNDESEVAPAIGRLGAGLIDILILAAIDGAVLHFTLLVVGLTFADVRQLPAAPLAVFLLLLNGGYLAIFTAAGGQTIGKMLTGIKVVAARPADDAGFDRFTTRVTMGAAVLRATAYLVSLLPAGLGFAAILFDRDGRALHDRLAETRVVRA
jgi:uncharacterized RDD family membrane protein YckC